MTTAKLESSKAAHTINEDGYPCFTFYFRVHSGTEKAPHDLGHIRSRCHEVIRALSSKDEVALLAHIDDLLSSLNLKEGQKSIGIFLSPKFGRVDSYYLNIPERHYVGNRFSFFESLYAEFESSPYLLFVLNQRELKTYSGNGNQIETLVESAQYVRLQKVFQQCRQGLADKDGKAIKSQHIDPKWKAEFLRALSDLCHHEQKPAYFLGIKSYEISTEELLAANIDLLYARDEQPRTESSHDLKIAVEALIDSYRNHRTESLLNRCHSARSSQKLASGWDEILRCAQEGRVEMLILEAPTWDKSGALEFSDQHKAIDLSLSKHGQVEFVLEGTLKPWGGAAAILRY